MTVVVGAKCRDSNRVPDKVVASTDRATLHGCVDDMTKPDMVVCADDAKAHDGIPNPHETVKHGMSDM